MAMESKPFALEQLDGARYSIQQAVREMAALREAVTEKLQLGTEEARPYHTALQKTKFDLVAALDRAGAALEEMSELELGRGAKKLRDAVSAFPVMTKNYVPLLRTLNQFCDRLPADEGSLGRVLGRLMNLAKMGYYPTDLTHMGYLRDALDFPDGVTVNLLDPCCGEGHALKALAPPVNGVTYGTELSTDRAEAACEHLNRVAMGDFFRCRISRGAFHVVFLNPPYLAVPNGQSRIREEKRFLIEALPCLLQGGILIYIIPYYRMTPGIARCLCDNFTDLGIYRFEGVEFDRFRQVAIIGRRRRRQDGSRMAAQLYKKCELGDKLPGLSTIEKACYHIPPETVSVDIFCGSIFNELELYRQMRSSDSVKALYCHQNELDRMDKRPLLPLNAGQIGLIGGSGMLDGLVECNAPHVIRGMITKETISDEQVIDQSQDGRTKTLLQTDTVTNKLTFHVLTADGYKCIN